MIRFIIIALVFGGGIAFILSEIFKYFNGISGTRSAALRDMQALSDLVDQFELAPWDIHELDLISRDHQVHSKAELHGYTEYGVFYSIYQEPIMAFATKEYDSNSRKLAIVKFNGRKYYFNQYLDKVVMTTDQGSPVGEVVLDNGLSITMYGRQLHIDADARTTLIPLSINQRDILAIATDDDTTGQGGRMLRRLDDYDEQKEGELILISIAFALANKQI